MNRSPKTSFPAGLLAHTSHETTYQNCSYLRGPIWGAVGQATAAANDLMTLPILFVPYTLAA